MRNYWHKMGFASVLAAILIAGTSAAWAGGRHHYPHHGYRGHSTIGFGVNIGFPGYWGGYPPYGPVYGPAYRPPYAGSFSIGYSSGYHNALSLGLSLPLYVGPRPAPAPVAVAVPAGRAVPQQAPADCLQTREYQTEIVIDGRYVPAYGQACLQADGSWKMISAPVAANY